VTALRSPPLSRITGALSPWIALSSTKRLPRSHRHHPGPGDLRPRDDVSPAEGSSGHVDVGGVVAGCGQALAECSFGSSAATRLRPFPPSPCFREVGGDHREPSHEDTPARNPTRSSPPPSSAARRGARERGADLGDEHHGSEHVTRSRRTSASMKAWRTSEGSKSRGTCAPHGVPPAKPASSFS